MLLSTQPSGILVGTDKIVLFLEDSDKTSPVGNKRISLLSTDYFE